MPLPAGSTLSRTLVASLVVTAGVTALSRGLPEQHAATAVGLAFLGATWWLVLRRDDDQVTQSGLALGGLLEPERIDARRVVPDTAHALALAGIVALVIFPPFVYGYSVYWSKLIRSPFTLRLSAVFFKEDVLGQLLGIALPEEAFYRGYLQSALDKVWPPRHRVLGAMLGPSLVVSSAIFAAGHLLTEWHVTRLAVFFPSLVFGWLRARSGGIGASVVFHAACNLLVIVLARGYLLAK
jgi:hypothetical protein